MCFFDIEAQRGFQFVPATCFAVPLVWDQLDPNPWFPSLLGRSGFLSEVPFAHLSIGLLVVFVPTCGSSFFLLFFKKIFFLKQAPHPMWRLNS